MSTAEGSTANQVEFWLARRLFQMLDDEQTSILVEAWSGGTQVSTTIPIVHPSQTLITGILSVSEDYSIRDAVLTPLGRKQCMDFAQANPGFQNIPEVILTSAFRRTLATTLLALPEAYKRLAGQGKVILLPQLQETHDYPCDTGSDRAVLEATDEFKDMAVDWSTLTDDWNKNEGFYAPTVEALKNRAKWVRRYVRDRPEKTIVLVGHGGIFREIDGRSRSDDLAVVESLARWANVESRLYTFASDDDEDAALIPIVEPSLAEQVKKPRDPHVHTELGGSS